MAKDNELKILDGKATTQLNEPKLAVKKKGLTLSEKLKQRAEDKKRKKEKKQN